MVKARAQLEDGRFLLVIGLSDGNIARLREDRVIHFDVEELKLKPGEVVGQILIFNRATENDCFNALEQLMGPDTEHEVRPRGSQEVQ